MSPLSADAILKIWELGQNQHPLDRALTILLGNGQGVTRSQLAALPVVQRDQRLLEVREQNFGSILNGFAQCPACAEKLEYTLSTTDIRSMMENDLEEHEDQLEVAVKDMKIIYRLPDSRDLAVATGCDDVDSAHDLIVQRCVREGYTGGKLVDIKNLPPEAFKAIAAQMSKYQEQLEVSLEFQCPTCSFEWQTPFDIASFLWREISVSAMRLLRDVHTLAKACGWSQAEILALSPQRRQFYLEAVTW